MAKLVSLRDTEEKQLQLQHQQQLLQHQVLNRQPFHLPVVVPPPPKAAGGSPRQPSSSHTGSPSTPKSLNAHHQALKQKRIEESPDLGYLLTRPLHCARCGGWNIPLNKNCPSTVAEGAACVSRTSLADAGEMSSLHSGRRAIFSEIIQIQRSDLAYIAHLACSK